MPAVSDLGFLYPHRRLRPPVQSTRNSRALTDHVREKEGGCYVVRRGVPDLKLGARRVRFDLLEIEQIKSVSDCPQEP